MDEETFWSTVPAFGISGFSGSGKTTLIEQLLPHLLAKGLSVAVLKHDVHGVQVDQSGKDSDRFYQAGADVVLQGAGETFYRRRERERVSLRHSLHSLAHHHDLVLVEGHKASPLSKIWLLDEGGQRVPEGVENVLTVLARGAPRLPRALALLESWLTARWRKTPVYGCVLIGGQSSRMGQPKHLLEYRGRTWLEHTLACMECVAEEVVIVGKGEVPDHLSHYPRLADVPAVRGPMAGMLAAMRWGSDGGWLMCACDMPQLRVEALRWLLDRRAPGRWATLPDLNNDGYVEPLLAYYDPRARGLLEDLLMRNIFAPSVLASHPKTDTAVPPQPLCQAWRNVNSKADLAAFEKVLD